MKLVFSEARSDYEHFIFPYAVWAFPEPGETPDLFFKNGFLPSSTNLDRFYLCRQLRVDLSKFQVSSENRRILRKGTAIHARILDRPDYDYTPERREFFKICADARFGPNRMSCERLDRLMSSQVITHVATFEDTEVGKEVGAVLMYRFESEVLYYYYAFYDLTYSSRKLGMYMMTWMVNHFAPGLDIEANATPVSGPGVRHIYLGTCYSTAALYKTQFAGIEFFTGYEWSSNLADLKFRIAREQQPVEQHLLEDSQMSQFYPGNVPKVCSERSRFSL